MKKIQDPFKFIHDLRIMYPRDNSPFDMLWHEFFDEADIALSHCTTEEEKQLVMLDFITKMRQIINHHLHGY